MIEPTETETLETLDSFAEAMIKIAEETESDPELVKAAPHSAPIGKLDDAKAAAATFVALMDLTPDRDQVAIVRFDTEAELVQVLTSDRGQVESAIRQLENRSGTYIDRGLQAGLLELQSERRNPDNMRVIVLLTDGIQTGETGAELVAARQTVHHSARSPSRIMLPVMCHSQV